jgi:hypothetical protein
VACCQPGSGFAEEAAPWKLHGAAAELHPALLLVVLLLLLLVVLLLGI